MSLLYYILFLIFYEAHGRKLIQGNIIWRHGDRSSFHTYPNDPYKFVWKDGKMQLTSKGMTQAYELGLYLKSKYGNLISKKYKENEIYIKSTDTDRTIMTAQCVVSGLYALPNSTIGKSTIAFRPFPIHTDSLKRDWLYNRKKYPEKGCKAFADLLKKGQNESKFYKSLLSSYAHFFKNMTFLTGMKEPYDFNSITDLYDNLICLRSNNYTLPKWVDDNTTKSLAYLAGLHQGLACTDYELKYAKTLSKMTNGIILGNMLENMEKRIRNETQYSLVGYSAHDNCITTLLVSIGAHNWIIPPYASCVMLDLYLENDLSYSVELWYRNDSTQSPHRLPFYKCGTSCSFEQFQKVASEVVPGSDNARLCGISDGYCGNFFLIGLAILVTNILLFVSVYYCIFKRNPYSRLPQHESDTLNLKSM
ncbi:prostatic acid phosphatase-like [Styela clava]